MNGDILPPKRPTPSPQPVIPANPQASQPQQPVVAEAPKAPLLLEEHTPLKPLKKRSPLKILGLVLGVIVALLVATAVAGFLWYQQALSPVSSDKDTAKISVTIKTGSTPSQIANTLAEKKIIRSAFAFNTYTRLDGTQNSLQAGSYRLSPAESTQDIVKHLVSGKIEEFTLTFYPGATLTDTTNKAENKKVDVTTILKRAGYSSGEISAAFKKTYDHPLFADKPETADLEGYVYGETYNFATSATVENILTRTFDEFYAEIQANDLVNGFKKQNLNLYQGITLASIIQREVGNVDDQKQVAQIFYKRLGMGMPLGADATFVYGAMKLGVTPSVDVESPYNTRKHVGLPPGPIAAPGKAALLAVAGPANGDFLYFVSGDDGTNYFSRTLEEHETNTRNYCHENCRLF